MIAVKYEAMSSASRYFSTLEALLSTARTLLRYVSDLER